jgi:hypothetical protein
MKNKTNIRTATALAVACSVLLGCKHPTPQTSSAPAAPEYPLAEKIAKRDGTNYLGVYLGMIAELDGSTAVWDGQKMVSGKKPLGVMMFSATTGQLLRWISCDEFKAVYVDKTKPEYPR